MPRGFQVPDIAGSFIAGRQARQQEDYAETRNALARMEAEQAPREIANRNALMQQQQQQFTQEQAMQALTKGKAAAEHIAQHPQAKAFAAGQFPEFVRMAEQRAGKPWDALTDQEVQAFAGDFAQQAAAKLGMGPAPPPAPLSAPGKIGADVRSGYLTPEQASSALSPGMTEYQRQMLDLKRQQMTQGGSAAGQFTTLTPEEVAAEGLPKGTVAQRSPQGKISVIKKPDAAGGGVKLTEGDKKARVMFSSMLNAEKDLAKVTSVDTSSGTQIALGSNPITKGMQSDEFRKYKAAGLRWAANLLYLKSGATATPDEIQSTWQQFFPQFGDGPGAKAEKAAARAQELTAVADTFGLDKSEIPQGPAEPQQAAPAQGIDERGYQSLPPGTVYRAPDGSLRRKR